jgi:hypothetical protein
MTISGFLYGYCGLRRTVYFAKYLIKNSRASHLKFARNEIIQCNNNSTNEHWHTRFQDLKTSQLSLSLFVCHENVPNVLNFLLISPRPLSYKLIVNNLEIISIYGRV